MVFNGIKSLFTTELQVLRSILQLFGPLGILCRITGQFPVNASLTGNTLFLRYSFFSIASIYNVLMTNLPCAVYLYERIRRKHFKNLYAVYSVLFRFAQILIQLLITRGWSDVCGLVAELENFDSKLYRLPVLVKRKPIRKSNKLVWLTVPFLQLFNIIYIEIGFGWKNHLYYSIRPVCAVPLMLQTILFFFFLTELLSRTKYLQQSWILYLKIAARHNYSTRTLSLDLYRSLHTNLVHCFSLLNSAFAFTLFAAVSLLFLDLITEPYHAYKSGHFGHRFSDRLWCFVLVAFVSIFTTKLDRTVNIVLDDIFDIRVSGISKCMRSHLDLLVYHLDRSKIQIQVPGLVVFSRQFIGSFVIVSVTYFILAAQIAAQFLE